MIDHNTALLALRNRAIGLSVVTTGSTTLTATATGFERAAGSFITDGFAVGMELTGSGFSVSGNNAAHVVTAVATLTLTATACTADASAAGRTLAVGLPALRALTNVDFTPTAGRWYVEEDYLPGPVQQITLGAFGQVETLPQYVLKLYGLAGTGTTALFKMADALLARFAPRQEMVLSDGNVVIVRTNPAPYRGQSVRTVAGGWSMLPVTVSCLVRSANSI